MPVFLEGVDTTQPDVLRGEGGRYWVGQMISNASATTRTGWSIVATAVLPASAPSLDSITTPLHPLPGSTQIKAAIAIPVPQTLAEPTYTVRLALTDERGNAVHERSLVLKVLNPSETHSRTFVSGIDGSVQYFSVVPQKADGAPVEESGLILSLHGASVEAISQARAYQAKDWATVVAATNRRPFGFDWEDWGRMDALEVLGLAESTFPHAPDRVYLTGHSMGGHGTWQVGAQRSDRFAAIAPSAGWRSFWDYGGGATFPDGDPVAEVFSRAVNPSRTLEMRENYDALGVYVLHGDADDVVRVSEARAMRSMLGERHRNFAYYEQPGAGHWWGNECLDWPPLIRFLRDNRLADARLADDVRFTSASPAIRSRQGWIEVEQAQRPLDWVRVHGRIDGDKQRIRLELENVARFRMDLGPWLGAQKEIPEALKLEVGDSEWILPAADWARPQAFSLAADGTLRLETGPAPAGEKSPQRMGPFKEGFRNRFVLVYGTGGNETENKALFAKARYDLEVWRYRGNGNARPVRDRDFVLDAVADRNLVLYGNEETNRAWAQLVDPSGFGGTGSRARGGPPRKAAVLPCSPCCRAPNPSAIRGVVPAPKPLRRAPHRTTALLRLGVAYPDWTVLDRSFLQRGWARRARRGLLRPTIGPSARAPPPPGASNAPLLNPTPTMNPSPHLPSLLLPLACATIGTTPTAIRTAVPNAAQRTAPRRNAVPKRPRPCPRTSTPKSARSCSAR
ncbi:MAG: prolyl oligopeptidase family serine peptidase [Planctomycetota bacterium]